MELQTLLLEWYVLTLKSHKSVDDSGPNVSNSSSTFRSVATLISYLQGHLSRDNDKWNIIFMESKTFSSFVKLKRALVLLRWSEVIGFIPPLKSGLAWKSYCGPQAAATSCGSQLHRGGEVPFNVHSTSVLHYQITSSGRKYMQVSQRLTGHLTLTGIYRGHMEGRPAVSGSKRQWLLSLLNHVRRWIKIQSIKCPRQWRPVSKSSNDSFPLSNSECVKYIQLKITQ